MEGNYWDIDTLLADEESIPNIFLTTGANLAFLDPLAMKGYGDRDKKENRKRRGQGYQNEEFGDEEEGAVGEEDLPAGSQVNLPLWLTEEMVNCGMTSVNMPKYFNRRFRDEIVVSGDNINIKSYCDFYYEVGSKIARICNDTHLQRVLRLLYSSLRFNHILDVSMNSRGEDITDIIHSLPYLERKLFVIGYNSTAEYYDYIQGLHLHMEAAQIYQKRSLNEVIGSIDGSFGESNRGEKRKSLSA